ncbi:hypothetical protein KFE25_001243 [Diacronema lutheri]|uniref:Uncharacterized protein n=1 Tax=Diacronema lutheri TaxID=2081491 RepID=A0A8J5X6N2_DIALT|nr:hypothetical protein KFE25_001243 [Diacronema lutheri]
MGTMGEARAAARPARAPSAPPGEEARGRPSSAVTRSGRLFDALGSRAAAAPRLGAPRCASARGAELRASLARSYPRGALPASHALAPRRPSSAPGRAWPYVAVSPQWSWTGGGARDCLAAARPASGGAQPLSQEGARDALAASLPGPPRGASFGQRLDSDVSLSQLFASGAFGPPSFEFQRDAAVPRSPGPAHYEPLARVGAARGRPVPESSAPPRRADAGGGLGTAAHPGPSLPHPDWPLGRSFRARAAGSFVSGAEGREAGKVREGFYWPAAPVPPARPRDSPAAGARARARAGDERWLSGGRGKGGP